jgi:hypothetical protein
MPSHASAPNEYFNGMPCDWRKQVFQSGFGMNLLYSGLQFAVPLWWVSKDQTNALKLRNGSAFLVNQGHGIFAVTAAHVLAEYIAVKNTAEKIECQLGSLEFDLEARLISRHDELDIATFRVTDEEATHIGKRIVLSDPPIWEPLAPAVGEFAFFAGFPARNRWVNSAGNLATAPYFAMPPITSITDRQIACRFQRETMIAVGGTELPPQGYDIGGISGGPLLMPTLIRQDGVEGAIWRFAGVVVEAARGEFFDQIVAVRSNYFQPNGKIG